MLNRGNSSSMAASSESPRGHGPSGTGLGLSICQSIVHNHGGAIHCESEPGRGTCITATFPLASAAVEPAGA
jgi:signal transduction histidine kinase